MRAIQDPSEAAKFASLVIRRHLPDPAYRIFLFGSRATGSVAERSDIDIGIEGPAPVPHPALAAIQEALEEAPTLFTIDVVDSCVCRRNSVRWRNSASHCENLNRCEPISRAPSCVLMRLLPSRRIRSCGIPRFSGSRFSFELCWKFLKAYLEEQHNALCTSPRTCFRSGFRARGHRQRSVLDRSDGFAKLHPSYL
jgi:predicted nucleotidyltransferase